MLRKGLVALMMGVICAGSAFGDEPAQKQTKPAPAGVLGWFRSKSSAKKQTGAASTGKATLKSSKPVGIEHAVVTDAENLAISVRQTSGHPQDSAPPELLLPPVEQVTAKPVVTPAESALQPVQIQQAPVLPNLSTVSGPQYFSATPAGMSNPVPVHPSGNWQSYQAPVPVHRSSAGQYSNASQTTATGQVYSGYQPMYPQTGLYPQTGAALYPAPVPGIPQQIGGAAIMNQAFHPHEMLYAHRYSAMYPPYYYKVNGGWMVTPFGVWSQENWKLQGTRVDVKYKSHISPFSGFHPPMIR